MVSEVKEGILLNNIEDIKIDLTIEEIESLIQEAEEKEVFIIDLLNEKEIDFSYIPEGFYTYEEFKNDIGKNNILMLGYEESAQTKEDYYNLYENVYFYEYFDGSNHRAIQLDNEGEKAIKLDKLIQGNTYQIDLYYNLDSQEFRYIYNSYYQGTLLSVMSLEEVEQEEINTAATEQEYQELINKINNLYRDIETEKEKANYTHRKAIINITEEEKEILDYLENYYYFEIDEEEKNKLYID